MANVIDIIVNGQDHASKVFRQIGNTAENAFEQANDAFDRMERDMRNIRPVDIHVNVDTSEAFREITALKKKIDDLEKEIKKPIPIPPPDTKPTENALRRISNSMKELGQRGRELGEGMVDMAENLAQGITVPLALIGGVAIKASGDIDRMFSILQAKVGGSAEAMKRLTPIVQQVFRDGLGKDLNEIAEIAGHAQRQLWKLNDAQLSGVINNVAALSTILGIDAVGAIDQARELMMKFGISSDQAMDLVAAGVQTADLNSKNLATTLKQVKGRAEEITGIASDDTWVRFTSMWRQLQEELKPVGDELADLALKYLPAVIKQVEGFSKWFSSLSDSAKLTTVAFASFLAVLPLILMTLGALILIGSSVIGFFGTLGGWLTTAGEKIAEFASKFKTIRPAVLGISAGITLVVGLLIALYQTSEDFANFVDGTFRGIWESLKNTFEQFSVSLEPLKKSFDNLGTTLSDLWETVKPLAEFLGYVLGGALILVAGILNGLLRAIAPLIQLIIDLAAAVVNLADGLIKLLAGDYDGFIESMKALGENMLNVFMDLGNVLIEFFSGLWDTLVEIAAQFGVDLNQVMADAWTWVTEKWNSLVEWFANLWSQVTEGITGAWEGVVEFFSSIWESIVTAASDAWNQVVTVISEALAPIMEVITPIIEWIKYEWGELKEFFSILWAMLKALFQVAWMAIVALVMAIVTPIVNWLSEKWTAIKNAASNAWNALVSLASSIWNSIVNAVMSVVTPIVNWLSQKWNSIKNTASSAWNATKSLASSVWKSVVTTVQNAVTPIVKWLSDKWNSVKNTASTAWNSVKDSIVNPIKKAKDTVTGIIDDIVGAFAKMKITIPKPRLPKISVSSASTSVGGISIPYPKFSLSWFAKGGLFNAPSVIGVGEAGDEAVVPLSGRRMSPFAKTIASEMDKSGNDKEEGGGVNIVIENLTINGGNLTDRSQVQKLMELFGDEIEKRLRLS